MTDKVLIRYRISNGSSFAVLGNGWRYDGSSVIDATSDLELDLKLAQARYDDRWVTMEGNHVLIGGNGLIKAGVGGRLKGRKFGMRFKDYEHGKVAKNGKRLVRPYNLTGKKNGEKVASKVGKANKKIVGGVRCEIIREKHVFSDGTGMSSRKPEAAVIYRTPEGAKFIFQEKGNKNNQTMTPEMAISLYQKVPRKIRELGATVFAFVDYENPQDEYWRKVYKNFSRSYATGNENEVTFYKQTREHNKKYVTYTYCHELGHGIDRRNGYKGGWFSDSTEWTNAMSEDYRYNKKKSPTEYGTNSNAEDFAESMAEYAAHPRKFKKNFPNRVKLIEKILKG